jgi:tRNA 2-thiouridine synthesizing protein E
MSTTTLDDHQVHVDEEGFLTEYDEWDEDLAQVLATKVGIDLTDAHWQVIRFLRKDFLERGETATTRRVQVFGGVPVKEQFALFPRSPARRWRTSPDFPSRMAACRGGGPHDCDRQPSGNRPGLRRR